MGRSIPSVSHRMDAKLADWGKFRQALYAHERDAFDQLVAAVKNKRTAIDALDEPDMGVALLLAMAVFLRGNNRVPTAHPTTQQKLEDGLP